MASTTIPDVKASVFQMLKVLPIVSDEKVTVYYSFRDDMRRDCIWLGNTHISELEPAGFRAGRIRRHESFALALYVETTDLKPDRAEQDAFAIVRAIEQGLADDPKIGNTENLSWALVEDIESEIYTLGDGYICQIETSIRCRGNFV